MAEQGNDKVLKILERQYASFINQQENWEFFRGLADYVKTIQEMIPTKLIVETLEKQRQASRIFYEQMSTQAFKEFQKSAQRMIEIAEKFGKRLEPVHLMKSVQEVQGYLNGTIQSSDTLQGIDSALFDVARRIKDLGLANKIKQFEDNTKRFQNIYGNYTFSPTYETLHIEKEKLERKEQAEPWGAWGQLPLVKRLVFEPDEIKAEVKAEAEADKSLWWRAFNFVGVAGEMGEIRTGEKSDNDVVFFKVKDFKSFAQRVHNYIIIELLKEDNGKKLDFEVEKSILYFAGEEILISKNANSDAHDLLRTIFKDRHRIWNTDEVLDDWKFDIEKKTPRKKVYHAGKAVNRIVAQETKLKDFLSVSTKAVAITKKYLSG